MINLNQIETESVTFFFEDGILNIVYKQEIDIKIEHIKANIIARKQFQKTPKALLLVDFRKAWHISNEARIFLASSDVTDLNIAMAILVEDLNSRLTANFFIKFNKPICPTKMFDSKQKAITWLETFK